jgi:mannose/fructose/N-acetylgalactosamine-specific phosphotransferase system component IIC
LAWNKQLDFQILLTQIGRELSRSGGWYGQRRPIQAAFAISCAALGMVCAVAGLRAIWRKKLPAYVAYIGVIFLLTFIAIRAASFHHIDTLLYRHPMLGSWLNTGLESGGVMLVALGGVLALRTKVPR